jgi:hypothetical protein
MKPWHARINLRWAGQVLAWTAFLAATLLVAFMLQTLVAGAPSTPGPAVSPATCPTLSPSTAALADGDDIQARFLATLAARQEALQPTPESVCASPSGQEPRPHPVG